MTLNKIEKYAQCLGENSSKIENHKVLLRNAIATNNSLDQIIHNSLIKKFEERKTHIIKLINSL